MENHAADERRKDKLKKAARMGSKPLRTDEYLYWKYDWTVKNE